ncbi:MAG: hypothetical protein ABSH49_36715 [Bryobacteraceae bacterium]|jgi:hypothetical protein
MIPDSEPIREIDESERPRFKPFIWIVTEDGAHSFLTAVAEKQVKVLWMTEHFEHLSKSAKLEKVQDMIRRHYKRTGGKYAGFGAILRYQYSDTFDTSSIFDVEGNVIEKCGGRFLLPEVWMQLHK